MKYRAITDNQRQVFADFLGVDVSLISPIPDTTQLRLLESRLDKNQKEEYIMRMIRRCRGRKVKVIKPTIKDITNLMQVEPYDWCIIMLGII